MDSPHGIPQGGIRRASHAHGRLFWLMAAVLAAPATSIAAQELPVVPPLLGDTVGVTAHPAAPVQVRLDSETHHVVVSTGPWTLAPMDMMGDMPMMDMAAMDGGHASHNELLLVKFAWPETSWLRGFKLVITDRNGRVLPQRTMHHMEVINYDRRQLVYPEAERMLGIGEETAAIKVPRSVGLPMEQGQNVGVYLMWNNDTGHELDGIHLRLELITAPANLTPRPLAAFPFKVDVNNHPGLPDSYDVPPGGLTKSYQFKIATSGRLLAVGGHLHDHAVEMRIEDVASGKVLATVHAIRDSEGHVSGVSRTLLAVKSRGPHLKAGHTYRLVCVYDNPTTEVIPGVMCVMGGLFAPDDVNDWPVLDRNNPEYIRDIAAATGDPADIPTIVALAGRR